MSINKPSMEKVENNFVLRNLYSGISKLANQKRTLLPVIFFLFLILVGLFGPFIAPYEYTQNIRGDDGTLLRAESPSLSHPLGTTEDGQDVLSRLIIGAQPTVITAVLGGAMIAFLGLSIGIISGYFGGYTEEVLMRITDFAYSLPLIPFAIVLLAFFGIGFYTTILVIGMLLWRSSARVIRSQVLQVKERSYVGASRTMGGSRKHIISKHIIPNIAPMAILFFAMGMGWAVITQAGLAFIGVTSPFVPSWGVMIRNAYTSGYLASQPTWAIAPGIMISLTVLSAYLIGQAFEEPEQGIA
jgi:peptide/nickel transport system permease protein